MDGVTPAAGGPLRTGPCLVFEWSTLAALGRTELIMILI